MGLGPVPVEGVPPWKVQSQSAMAPSPGMEASVNVTGSVGLHATIPPIIAGVVKLAIGLEWLSMAVATFIVSSAQPCSSRICKVTMKVPMVLEG